MKCRICQSEASKHNHYGSVQVCYSCRAFFMRSVQSSMFKMFEHNDKTVGCIIDSKTRKSCKKCRFNKCLEMGMKVSFVMPRACPKKELLFDNVLTLEEESQLKALNNMGNDACNDCLYEILESNLKYAYLMFDQLPNNPQLMLEKHAEDISKIQKLGYSTLCQIIAKDTLLEDIIHVLIDHNFGRILTFSLFISFGRSCEKEKKMNFVNHGKQHRKASAELDVILQLAEKFALNSSNDEFYQYETFFDSPWACQSAIEDEHASIARKVGLWYDRSKCSNANANVDDCLNILMIQILLFNTNGLKSLNAVKLRQAERHQQKCVNLLLKYLKSHLKRETSYHQLHTALMLISDTQRAFELSQMRLQLNMMESEENLDLLSLQ